MNLMRISLLFLIVAAFSCSDKESEEPWGLTGDVRGKIFLYTEFGALENDQSGAIITFPTGGAGRSVTTDAEGRFVVEDIPMGTFGIVIEKPGFAPRTISGYRLLGGRAPSYLNTSIGRPSTSKVTNLSAEYNFGILSLTGTMIHNNSNQYVYAALYANTSPDVSPTNYTHAGVFSFNIQSGGSFTQDYYLDRNKFPSGSKVYIVMYGATNYYYFDVVTEKIVINGVGNTPSNVISVTVP